MADALLSPPVGGAMWAASAGTIAICSSRVSKALDDRRVPLMGVLGAFLFAAQMINFTIPGTGSSGHIGGGLLLAILLGPSAAFLTLASVLVVQALFFADGGLLALGCNIFNLGFFPAFIVYPFFYSKLVGDNPGPARHGAVTIASAVLGLQLGAFSVVLETVCSGVSSLPFSNFVLLMQPIHLAIGIIEGVATLAIVSYVRKARPEIVERSQTVAYAGTAVAGEGRGGVRAQVGLAKAFLLLAVFTAGVLSWFASKNPDGLEWAVAKVTGKAELQAPQQGVHRAAADLQAKSAFFPDYSFKLGTESKPAAKTAADGSTSPVALGTSVAGIAGAIMTLALVLSATFVLRKWKRNGR